MTDPGGELDRPDPTGDYLELAALLSSPLPLLGGALQQLFGGRAHDRRLRRVRDVLVAVEDEVTRLGATIRKEYVRSDEFRDLLEHAVRRVAFERHEEKHRLYRNLLVSAVTTPADYDEQLEFLRVIERLQLAHMALLRVLRQLAIPSGPGAPRYQPLDDSSQVQTLRDRLPEMSEDRITELMRQLDDLRLVNAASLHAMGSNVVDLRNTFTDFGKRFIAYVLEEDGSR